jgi:hypothetical protein
MNLTKQSQGCKHLLIEVKQWRDAGGTEFPSGTAENFLSLT